MAFDFSTLDRRRRRGEEQDDDAFARVEPLERTDPYEQPTYTQTNTSASSSSYQPFDGVLTRTDPYFTPSTAHQPFDGVMTRTDPYFEPTSPHQPFDGILTRTDPYFLPAPPPPTWPGTGDGPGTEPGPAKSFNLGDQLYRVGGHGRDPSGPTNPSQPPNNPLDPPPLPPDTGMFPGPLPNDPFGAPGQPGQGGGFPTAPGPLGPTTGPGFGNQNDFLSWYEQYVTGAIQNPSRYDNALVQQGTEVIEAALDRMRDKGTRSVGEWAASRGLVGSSLEGERVSDLEEELMRLAEERVFQLGREQANTYANDRNSALGLGATLGGLYNQQNALDLQNRQLAQQQGQFDLDLGLRERALDSSNQLGYQQWIASLLQSSPGLADDPAFMDWLGGQLGGFGGPPLGGGPPGGTPGDGGNFGPPGEPGDIQGSDGNWLRNINGQNYVWNASGQLWQPVG